MQVRLLPAWPFDRLVSVVEVELETQSRCMKAVISLTWLVAAAAQDIQGCLVGIRRWRDVAVEALGAVS